MNHRFSHSIATEESLLSKELSYLEDYSMPRIPDYHLDSTFYLYPDEIRAQNGEGVGGTGFFCTMPPSKEQLGKVGYWASVVLVTNKHVIERGNWTIRANNIDGDVSIFDTDERDWVFSKDYDLAVYNKGYHALWGSKIHAVDGSVLLTRQKKAALDIGIGDDIFMIGRFINWDGRQTNKPVARFGNISQFPDMSEVGGKILVEIRSIGGFSGSPVFVQGISNNSPEIDKLNRPKNSLLAPILLGVNSAHTAYRNVILDGTGQQNRAGFYTAGHTGFAVIEPAWALKDLLMSLHPKESEPKEDLGVIVSDIDNAPEQDLSALSETLESLSPSEGLSESDEVLKKMLSTPPKPH